MINVTSENFVVHRRFILKIALKIDDREKNENFIVVDEASEANKTNEKEINKVIVINETINEKDVAIAKFEYLTKTFSTILMIMTFNS